MIISGMGVQEFRYESDSWLQLAQDCKQWRSLALAVLNHWEPQV
jgi:hypothetical protein